MAALSDHSHPQHKEVRDWVGTTYDPSKFDAWAVDHALALAVAWGAVHLLGAADGPKAPRQFCGQCRLVADHD